VRSRLVIAGFVALAVAGAVSACGGSSDNGVASKSPDAIVSAASAAIEAAQTVHISGSVASGNTPVTLDLSLVSGKGATGSMSESGLSFQIVALDQTVYINGSPAFWSHFGGSAAAALLTGRWLKAPETGQFASLAEVTDLKRLIGGLLASHGTLTKGPTTTINGRKVIAVSDATQGGTLYVATTGKPYPIQISKPGSQGGQLAFDRFNEPVSLTAPPNAIDISQLTSL
jgi:hypothetical protein